MNDMFALTVSRANKLAGLQRDIARVGVELAACCKKNQHHKGPLKRKAIRLNDRIADLKVALSDEPENMTAEQRNAAIARVERRDTHEVSNTGKKHRQRQRRNRVLLRAGLLNGEREAILGLTLDKAPSKKKLSAKPGKTDGLSLEQMAEAHDLMTKEEARLAELDRRVRAMHSPADDADDELIQRALRRGHLSGIRQAGKASARHYV
jgi:hypothetical protein